MYPCGSKGATKDLSGWRARLRIMKRSALAIAVLAVLCLTAAVAASAILLWRRQHQATPADAQPPLALTETPVGHHEASG